MDGLERGAVVLVAAAGDYGKPRPALVLQADAHCAAAHSVSVLPITSTLVEGVSYRIDLSPTKANGLKKRSQVMVDKTISVPKSKVGGVIGKVSVAQLAEVENAFLAWFGFA